MKRRGPLTPAERGVCPRCGTQVQPASCAPNELMYWVCESGHCWYLDGPTYVGWTYDAKHSLQRGVDACERCGRDRPSIDVGTMGNPNAIVQLECSCPRPRCPFCSSNLDDERCTNSECFMWRMLVPIPELR